MGHDPKKCCSFGAVPFLLPYLLLLLVPHPSLHQFQPRPSFGFSFSQSYRACKRVKTFEKLDGRRNNSNHLSEICMRRVTGPPSQNKANLTRRIPSCGLLSLFQKCIELEAIWAKLHKSFVKCKPKFFKLIHFLLYFSYREFTP